jgi:hypothetical protein
LRIGSSPRCAELRARARGGLERPRERDRRRLFMWEDAGRTIAPGTVGECEHCEGQ